MEKRWIVIENSTGTRFIKMGKGSYKDEVCLIILRNSSFAESFLVVHPDNFRQDFESTNQQVYL